MRVISGEARGRKLKTPEGYDVRPTTDNVKESIFNIISFDIEGAKVLDLFAGTGQMGIEAISRGAGEVVFVDNRRESLNTVRDNLKLCGFKAQVVQSDAAAFLEGTSKYDIIIIDPPYDSELYQPVFENIMKFDLLNEGGIIIAECRRDYALPEFKSPYFMQKEYRYGHIKVVKYSRGSES